jgi:hypothetical protein
LRENDEFIQVVFDQIGCAHDFTGAFIRLSTGAKPRKERIDLPGQVSFFRPPREGVNRSEREDQVVAVEHHPRNE